MIEDSIRAVKEAEAKADAAVAEAKVKAEEIVREAKLKAERLKKDGDEANRQHLADSAKKAELAAEERLAEAKAEAEREAEGIKALAAANYAGVIEALKEEALS